MWHGEAGYLHQTREIYLQDENHVLNTFSWTSATP